MSNQIVSATATDSAAQKMAARLRNLADHLDAHPNLVVANVLLDFALQLAGHGRDRNRALLAWADSMADITCSVRFYGDRGAGQDVHIHVFGTIGDRSEEVWDAIPGFASWLHANGSVEPDATFVKDFDLNLLRQFADAADAARRLVSTVDEQASA